MNRIFTVAAITLAATAAAFVQPATAAERNVFDGEAHLAMPATQSSASRETVRQAYLDQRAQRGIDSFNPESWRRPVMAGSGEGLLALFQRVQPKATSVAAVGETRAEVRAEFFAARATGELNPFDSETALRLPANTRQPAPAVYAQR